MERKRQRERIKISLIRRSIPPPSAYDEQVIIMQLKCGTLFLSMLLCFFVYSYTLAQKYRRIYTHTHTHRIRDWRNPQKTGRREKLLPLNELLRIRNDFSLIAIKSHMNCALMTFVIISIPVSSFSHYFSFSVKWYDNPWSIMKQSYITWLSHFCLFNISAATTIKIKILNNNSSWHLFLELIVTMDLTPIKSKAIIPKKHAVKRKRVASVLSVIDSVCVETANEIWRDFIVCLLIFSWRLHSGLFNICTDFSYFRQYLR